MKNGTATITAADILRRLLCHWSPFQECVIPNCCLPGWEADLLVIRRSGWCEEVEIKVSAADFRREWTKKAEKHTALMTGQRHWAGVIGRGVPLVDGVDVSPDPTLHEGSPGNGSRVYLYVRRPHIIRRFWFAMPADLAEALLPEVPEQYGVLAISLYTRVLRKPANLKQARKISDAERVKGLESTYHRFWHQLFARLRAPQVEPHSDADPHAAALEWLLAGCPAVGLEPVVPIALDTTQAVNHG